jgi:replicative DNA helicase
VSSLPVIHENIADTKPAKPITVPAPMVFTVDDLREQYLDTVEADFKAADAGKPLGPAVNVARDFNIQCRGKAAIPGKLGSPPQPAVPGHFRPGLIVLAGMAGCGKTALALTIAARAQCAAVYATFEMSVEELMDRHICRETGEFIDKFFDGAISRKKAGELYDRTKEAMPWLVHFDGLHPSATREDLKLAAIAAREVCERETGSKHLLIVIDSFHAMVRKFGLVTAEGKSVTEYTATNLMVNYLLGLKNELRASILLIGEQSNTNQNTDALSAADSRALAYAPNQFITLTLDTQRKHSKGHVDVTATFAKNRRGIPRKKVALEFRGRTMSFAQGAFDPEGANGVPVDDDEEDDE